MQLWFETKALNIKYSWHFRVLSDSSFVLVVLETVTRFLKSFKTSSNITLEFRRKDIGQSFRAASTFQCIWNALFYSVFFSKTKTNYNTQVYFFPFPFYQSIISFQQTMKISTIFIFFINHHLLFNNLSYHFNKQLKFQQYLFFQQSPFTFLTIFVTISIISKWFQQQSYLQFISIICYKNLTM